MSFIVINEGFVCENCHTNNLPADKTCRNHCHKCLWSKHLDLNSPGDRKSPCHGLMRPIAVTGSIDNYNIIHKCQTCGKIIKNKCADDDNFQKLIDISNQNLH